MGWGQILTLKNDPTCNFASLVDFIGLGWVQILTLKNDPTCISAPPVFIKYKIH